MRYIDRSLLQKEKLIFWTRPHWIIFTSPVLFLILAIIIWVAGPWIFLTQFEFYDLMFYEWLALAAAALGLFMLVDAYITYRTSEYGITDKRVLMKTGWIRRHSLEIFLDKIEAINVNQSILGRILSYGSLIIIGTGGTEDPFPFIPEPLPFRKKVQQQIAIDDQHRRGE